MVNEISEGAFPESIELSKVMDQLKAAILAWEPNKDGGKQKRERVTAMNEKPILFTGEMVRAVLGGRKTQTRRVMKPQPWKVNDARIIDARGRLAIQMAPWSAEYLRCPYGQPGDRLWVRETWRISTGLQHNHNGCVTYRDGESKLIYHLDGHNVHDRYGFIEKDSPLAMKWRPSIHMPRWASRINLEVTGVRVERVQDISEADADAEVFGGDFPTNVLPDLFPGRQDDYCHLSMPECFAVLWDSINLKRGFGWDANPWCWIVDFKVIDK